MRFFISSICILCTAGIAASQNLAEKENVKLIRELQKYDIHFRFGGLGLGDGKTVRAAFVSLTVSKKSLEGLKLLRPAQVDHVRIEAKISDLGLMEAFLKDVAGVPDLKDLLLRIHGGVPQEKDLAALAELKADCRLSIYIDFPDIDAAQVKRLTALKTAKGLKYLSFEYTDPMPEALKELEIALALPRDSTHFSQNIPRHMRKLVKLDDREEPMTKLMKRKVLAAIDCVHDSRYGSSSSNSSSGSGSSAWGLNFVQAYKMLRAAIDELDNRELTLNLAEDMVRLIEQKRRHGEQGPELEYISLDVQIWQMKMQKSAKPKAEK